MKSKGIMTVAFGVIIEIIGILLVPKTNDLYFHVLLLLVTITSIGLFYYGFGYLIKKD